MTDDLRQLAIVLFIEGEGDVPVTAHLRLGDVGVIGRKLRAQVLGLFEAEHDILRRHRLTIRPLGLLTQAERRFGDILGIADAFRQQTIGGREFLFR